MDSWGGREKSGTFPFGAPVLPCGVDIPTESRPVFVVGAYPSAFHVRWVPPSPWRPVTALPVDNEPTPFWDGLGAEQVFAEWQHRFNPDWGEVAPARLNGSSGKSLGDRWLRPLGYTRAEAHIVDCLPASRASVGVRARLKDTYEPFARTTTAPSAHLSEHPSENDIVREALAEHAERLRLQIEAAQPEAIVTLGKAAGRVVAALSGQPDRSGALTPETYGLERKPIITGRSFAWHALIHPAAPKRWQAWHDDWIAGLDPSFRSTQS